MKFDVNRVREDFPILSQKTKGGKNIIYFDNAATSQKPFKVIDAVSDFYRNSNANIHRGAHELGARATAAYEHARANIGKFFGAPENFRTVFTRGATESLNLVAQSWGSANIKEGDEILLSEMEHHANIVPWQMLAQRARAKIVAAKIREDGTLDMDDLAAKVSKKTKIISVTGASNVLGTVNDAATVAELAHGAGALFCLDAAQSAPHFLDDVSKIGCDFFSVSAHKCYGPTGVGVLIARAEILDSMPPYQGGGDMIESVDWLKTTFRPAPERFEAGTPNIAGAVGFSAAADYLRALDLLGAAEHERALLARMQSALESVPKIKIFGKSEKKVAIASFSARGIHPNDISVLLDASGIAIRTGHHCAEPLMRTLGVDGTCRASLAFYNTEEEVDFFAERLARAIRVLS